MTFIAFFAPKTSDMSAFINIEDYDASLHREILDSLTRGNDDIIEVCEDQAVAEMKGYLKSRYDVETIFGRRGADRHPLILMYAKDIAVYHIFCVHNPMKISEIRKSRYERAVEWLKMVSADEITIDGADMLPEETLKENSRWQIHSNPLRPTHF